MASMNVENKSVGEIEKITGNNKILLIAPHGFNGDKTKGLKADDENTGILTREIATRLNCYAIINEAYKKPEKETDPANKRINLNRRDQVEKYLNEEFLQPLKNFTKSIIESHGSALVLWVHGILDKNITRETVDGDTDNTHVVLGIGQGNSNNHYTANKETVDDLIRVLKENEGQSIGAALAKEESNYCGANENIMNQYFRNNGYDLSKVESIQMEIKYSGFRDKENIEPAAEAFSTAILNMPSVKTENKPNIELVERAYTTLAQIVSKHYQNAMIEAGQFIIKEFYGNDIERARNKDPIYKESLYHLIQRLHARDNGGPSKSWVYNAVNLVVQESDLANFQTYGNLELSKKVELLRVGDPVEKKRLIEETVEKGLPVRQLREKITELKSIERGNVPFTKGLLRVINRPDALFANEYKALVTTASLGQCDLNELDDLLVRAQKKRSEIDSDIKTLREHARNFDRLIKRIGAVKKQKSKEAKAKGMSKGEGIKNPAPKSRYNTYVLISALQKSIRWCEVNASRYFAQQLVEMGKPGGAFNRFMTSAGEDIGLADPSLIKYERSCLDDFENMIKKERIKKSEAFKYPELCEIVDRGAIAAALSYKSRLLPMLSFATLFEIYKKEDFSHDLGEYEKRFHRAIQKRDEKEAAYYAYILELFLDSEEFVFEITQKESEKGNTELIKEWTKEYKRDGEILFLVGIISLLCRDLDHSYGEYLDRVSDCLSSPIEEAPVPDRAYDIHTIAGRRMGRGLEHFFNEGAVVKNERFPNDWEERGKETYLQAEKEGLEKAMKVINAIKEKMKNIRKGNTRKQFIIQLPFEYKKAVLTQLRTSPNRPYAFIVEFKDGSRKFMKGPFKNIEPAQDHIIYNDVKSKLESEYLHPIQCEVITYNSQPAFLVCDELGKADLDKVEERKTELDGIVEVLADASNDVVPDPLKFLTEINKENKHIWIGMMVNYCFRWVFGLGDNAGRNLMLERSTGKIYSTDEILLRSGSHEHIWGNGNGRRPKKEKFELIRAFAESKLLNEVLIEVEKWKGSLDKIRREVGPISEEVEGRIEKFVEKPKIVLALQK